MDRWQRAKELIPFLKKYKYYLFCLLLLTWLISFLFVIYTCQLDLLKITFGSNLPGLPGIWLCRVTVIMRWVFSLFILLLIPFVSLMDRWLEGSLVRRWKVVTSLIVMVLIISGVVFMGWMHSEAKRGREAWLRRHWWGPGLWWNFSSASGFDLGYRGDERMLTLLRGETGSIELAISAEDRPCEHTEYGNLYEACELSLYGTIACSGDSAILPPGVRAEFTPPNVTLRVIRDDKSKRFNYIRSMTFRVEHQFVTHI